MYTIYIRRLRRFFARVKLYRTTNDMLKTKVIRVILYNNIIILEMTLYLPEILIKNGGRRSKKLN